MKHVVIEARVFSYVPFILASLCVQRGLPTPHVSFGIDGRCETSLCDHQSMLSLHLSDLELDPSLERLT